MYRKGIVLPQASPVGLEETSVKFKVLGLSFWELIVSELNDLKYIWFDDRYWSEILFRTIPIPTPVMIYRPDSWTK